MSPRNTIQDELNGLNSQLPSDQNGNPFSVPEGYFDGLADSIMAKINGVSTSTATAEINELSPFLAAISRDMPYQVPENYFSDSLEILPVLIQDDQEPAVLSFIGKEMPFEVPSGYFETLPGELSGRLKTRAKVVPLFKRKWMHVAAAAIVTGIITLSGIAYFSKPSVKPDAPIAQQLKNVSTRELDEFINSTTVTTNATAQNTTEVKQLLKDVSDHELEAFLDQVPTEEEEVVIN